MDSYKETNDFTPFKNIINEWYAKDISKKIKSAYKSKALKGEFTGPYALYGYQKDPDNKYHLIVDETTAAIVKRIFSYALDGISPFKIASILKKEGILKPRAKQIKDLGRYVSEKYLKYPFDWSQQTIISILKHEVYLGHIVCNKHASKSFKDRSLIKQPKDKWIKVENMHEAIIDENTFDKVQKIISVKKKNPKNTDEPQIFIDLLRCPDCGKTLTFKRTEDRKSFGHYACSTFRSFGKSYCTMHYIQYERLYEVILTDIQKHIKQAKLSENELLEHIKSKEGIKRNNDLLKYKNAIQVNDKRIETLDIVIGRLYEDHAIGKVDEVRFKNLLNTYESEQASLLDQNKIKSNEINNMHQSSKDMRNFIQVIKKYTEMKSLDRNILNEFIDKIVVYEPKYHEKQRNQQINIHYKFVGKIAIE